MNYTPPEPDGFYEQEYMGEPSRIEPRFTEAQLRSEVERVRRETVEECAKVCYTIKETVWDHSSPPGQYETTASQAVECAKKIKELLK